MGSGGKLKERPMPLRRVSRGLGSLSVQHQVAAASSGGLTNNTESCDASEIYCGVAMDKRNEGGRLRESGSSGSEVLHRGDVRSSVGVRGKGILREKVNIAERKKDRRLSLVSRKLIQDRSKTGTSENAK